MRRRSCRRPQQPLQLPTARLLGGLNSAIITVAAVGSATITTAAAAVADEEVISSFITDCFIVVIGPAAATGLSEPVGCRRLEAEKALAASNDVPLP